MRKSTYHLWMELVIDLWKLKPKRWRTEIAVAAILLSEIPPKITTPPSIDNLGVATPFEVLWKSVYGFNLVIRYLPSCNSKMYFIVHPHHEEVGRKKGQELKIWVISERLGQIVPFSISSSAFFQRILPIFIMSRTLEPKDIYNFHRVRHQMWFLFTFV